MSPLAAAPGDRLAGRRGPAVPARIAEPCRGAELPEHAADREPALEAVEHARVDVRGARDRRRAHSAVQPQTRAVFIHPDRRLLKILALQRKKKELADLVIGGDESVAKELTKEDLEFLFSF